MREMGIIMMVRELVNIINIYDVSVNYDSREKVEKMFIKDNSTAIPIYFAVFDDIERKKYEKCKEKSAFITTTATIHFPDLTLSELVNLLECDGSGSHENTLKLISPFLNRNISENVVYVTYLFLHEVGHWFQLKNMKMKAEEYMNVDINAYKDNFTKMQQIGLEREERLHKGSSYNLTFREKQKLNKLRDEYRNIPKEKNADEFAINNLERALNSYSSYKSTVL